MSNPKLEFFRFTLNHKSNAFKTFRDFMVENGKATRKQQDNNIFASLFKYVMEKPKSSFEENKSLKKVITVIGKKKINKHFEERPKPDYPSCIISGVVNGGPFGKDRILANTEDKDDMKEITPSQPVLQYFYIFLYLPLDHDEGFIMVHSDSSEETITQAFRRYVTELFNVGDYKKPTMSVYVPRHFREEYRNGAILQSMSFINTELSDDLDDDSPLRNIIGQYEVKITFTPKCDEKADLSILESVKNFFERNRLGTKQMSRGLDEFGKCTISTKNNETNSTKTFDWNNRDEELMPAVYLKDRVAIGEDGTPSFNALDAFCHQLFKDKILPELRPDLYVRRVD